MTNLEYGIKKGLIKWTVNELFGAVYISIEDMYPKNDEDINKIIKFLAIEREEIDNGN